MKRKRMTCKEGADGRLYQIRDDGRTKLMRREKALKWARRNAPLARARLTVAYDAVDVNESNARLLAAERRTASMEKAAAALTAAGWTEDDDGSFALVRGDEVVARTTPETVAEFVDALGTEALRRKLLELGRGEAIESEGNDE